MEMLLMGAVLSMFGLAVACLAFGAATRKRKEPRRARSERSRESRPPARRLLRRCFPPSPLAARNRVPIEALLLADRKPRSPGTGGRRMLPRIPEPGPAAQQDHSPW